MPITKVWLTPPEEDIVGFVTPVLINNDGFHQIRDNPVKFVDDISDKMNYGGHSDNVNYTKTHPIGFTVIDTENAISRVQHKYSSELIGSHWISLD